MPEEGLSPSSSGLLVSCTGQCFSSTRLLWYPQLPQHPSPTKYTVSSAQEQAGFPNTQANLYLINGMPCHRETICGQLSLAPQGQLSRKFLWHGTPQLPCIPCIPTSSVGGCGEILPWAPYLCPDM